MVMIEDGWEFAAPPSDSKSNGEEGPITIVLVGKTGSGKSATGNSILGHNAFNSESSFSAVTNTCEIKTTRLSDGQFVKVIDTPGLFDSSVNPDYIGKEIVKCITLAEDGVHAFLLVLSMRARFSIEETAVIRTLQTFFGESITDYIIVVFTGGDELCDDQTLEDYFHRREPPEPLQELLRLCKSRMVLFDNKTKDKAKLSNQVQQLFRLVSIVIAENGGTPYSDKSYDEFKEGVERLAYPEGVAYSMGSSKEIEVEEQMQKTHEEQFKQITEMVELKIKETTQRLQEQLDKEQARRLEAEKIAEVERMKANETSQRLEQLVKEEATRMVEENAQAILEKSNNKIRELEERLATQRLEQLTKKEAAQVLLETSNNHIRKLEERFERERMEMDELRRRIDSKCAIL